VGLLEVTTLPLPSTATQRPLLGQETPVRELLVSTLVRVQAAAPPVGLLEVTTLPLPSTATQRPLLGQETPSRGLLPSTLVTVQAAAPPVGLLEVTTLPALSTATQKLLLGQNTSDREVPSNDGSWSIRTGAVHVSRPAVGVGDGAGVTAIWVGDALGGREACAFGPEALPQAARISTTARTAILT
jgi:hypothetical protein